MRSHPSTAGLLIGEALFVGCVIASLGGCAEPRAVTMTPQPISLAARDSIGQIRMGYLVDMDGKVPLSFRTSKFAVGNPIHFSMLAATAAPASSVVRVSVRDATDRVVWSEDKQTPQGGSYLSFDIGRKLARGNYRADVAVGHEVTSRTAFEVF